MKNFEYLESAIMNKPKTPSTWIGEPKYTPVTRIKISCGGGMGGASWYEYVHKVTEIPANTLVKFKRFDGKEFMLNTSFVVCAEDFTLAKVELDITAWKALSHYSKGDNIETYYVMIDEDSILKLA